MAKMRQRRRLATDMERLEKQLRRLCQGRLEPSETERLRVLDLACGECFEAGMLTRVMRELAAKGGERQVVGVEFVGADIRESEISRAADLYGSGTGAEGVDYRFLVKDGQKLTRDADFGEHFDVVFVRHQNYYLGGTDWHALFEQSLEKLAPEGKLVITSYFDHEHELAKDAIRKVGGELIEDIAHREARALAARGKRVDKRLAIFRRRHD